MQIISIANQKGGCGKTTTAINLASTLALNGARVLLIDIDPQSHATLGLNIESHHSMYNVISKLTPRKMQVQDIIVRAENSFDLVPSNILVGTLEQELADEIGRELKLAECLDAIKDNYDVILIDCPPSLGFLTVNAIRTSSKIIIPVETSRFSLQGVDHLMDIVTLIKDRLNHQVTCKILITMFDSRLRHSFAVFDAIKEKFGDMLLRTIIHVNVKLKESAFTGQSVTVYDKYSRGFKDYFSLAKEMISELKEQDTAFRPLASVDRGRFCRRTKESLKTTFTVNVPQAQSVYVTGTFNEWSLDETYRMKQEDGQWVLRVPLKSGVYRYRFIVDGRWCEDPGNPDKEQNTFGETDSILNVK